MEISETDRLRCGRLWCGSAEERDLRDDAIKNGCVRPALYKRALRGVQKARDGSFWKTDLLRELSRLMEAEAVAGEEEMREAEARLARAKLMSDVMQKWDAERRALGDTENLTWDGACANWIWSWNTEATSTWIDPACCGTSGAKIPNRN